MSEAENKFRLAEARSRSSAPNQTQKGSPKAKRRLTFREKMSRHWAILILAVFFDFLALIPAVGIVFNAGFGMLLNLISSSWKEDKKSGLTDIVLPIIIGSIFDLLLLGVVPVNVGAATYRIARSREMTE